MCEIHILNTLLKKGDPENDNFVRMLTWFTYKDHLCIAFEMLSINLYELLKRNNFSGLSLQTVKLFSKQLLKSLQLLQREKIIHCDLKPENILLRLDLMPVPQIKLIDFGSACFEKNTVYSYIQSRFYRSPEVLLGIPYTGAIDCWSLGCIAAELFLGLPLFPGLSQHRQLMRIFMMLGPANKSMLDHGMNTPKFFRREFSGTSKKADDYEWRLKTDSEIASETGHPIPSFKNYFRFKTLDDIILNAPLTIPASELTDKDVANEKQNRKVFLHFLHGLLKLDPKERWTFEEVALHPFITGEPFKPDWKPVLPINEKVKSSLLPVSNNSNPPPPVSSSSSSSSSSLSAFSSFFSKGITPLGSMSSASNSSSNTAPNTGTSSTVNQASTMPMVGNKLNKSKSSSASIPQHIVTSNGVHHVNSTSASFSFTGKKSSPPINTTVAVPMNIVVDESYFALPTFETSKPILSNSYTVKNDLSFSPGIGSGSFPSASGFIGGSAPSGGSEMMNKKTKETKKQTIAPSNPRVKFICISFLFPFSLLI